MAQTCSTMVLHCMDFRLGSAIRDELENRGILNDCDIVAIAGAGKTIVSKIEQVAWHDTAMSHIDLSKRLHSIDNLVIMNHTDCGAYGGRAAFESHAAEQKQHENDLRDAKEIVLETHPDLNVQLTLVHIADDGSISFESIE
jgi:carbonic anhydrase